MLNGWILNIFQHMLDLTFIWIFLIFLCKIVIGLFPTPCNLDFNEHMNKITTEALSCGRPPPTVPQGTWTYIVDLSPYHFIMMMPMYIKHTNAHKRRMVAHVSPSVVPSTTVGMHVGQRMEANCTPYGDNWVDVQARMNIQCCSDRCHVRRHASVERVLLGLLSCCRCRGVATWVHWFMPSHVLRNRCKVGFPRASRGPSPLWIPMCFFTCSSVHW